MSGHSHGHSHQHGAVGGNAEDRRRLLTVLVITATVLVAEVVGAVVSGSLALRACQVVCVS